MWECLVGRLLLIHSCDCNKLILSLDRWLLAYIKCVPKFYLTYKNNHYLFTFRTSGTLKHTKKELMHENLIYFVKLLMDMVSEA